MPYYLTGNPTDESVFGVPFSGRHPLREDCRASHADRLPASERYNVRLMDSHGGLLSTTPDLLRFLAALDNPSFIAPDLRSQMWQQPPESDTRVWTGGLGIGLEERSYDARNPDSSQFITLFDSGLSLWIGRGHRPFNRVTFELPITPRDADGNGAAEDLRFDYFNGSDFVPLTPEANNLRLDVPSDEFFLTLDSDDRTTVRFDPPEDWAPRHTPQADPNLPRYYLRISSRSDIAVRAEASAIDVPAGSTYGLGWAIDDDDMLVTLDVTNVTNTPALMSAARLVGGQSQTAGDVFSVGPSGVVTRVTLENITGVAFLPEEPLHLNDITGDVIARAGPTRERLMTLEQVSHDGKLNGVRTHMRRRADGISWAIMVNQSNTGGSFYVPTPAPESSEITEAITDIASWPSWDLFQPF